MNEGGGGGRTSNASWDLGVKRSPVKYISSDQDGKEKLRAENLPSGGGQRGTVGLTQRKGEFNNQKKRDLRATERLKLSARGRGGED